MGRSSGASTTSGSKTAAPSFTLPVLATRSVTFTRAGRVRLTIVGAGGSGAKAQSGGFATGGNSAPWGVKEFDVAASDVLALNIGTQAAGITAAAGANGNAGGATTAVLNGTTIMTVNGGEGGLIGSNPAAAAATVVGADYWVPGQTAGIANGSAGTTSGGAAVDTTGMGLGRSPNNGVGAGAGGSVGTNAGGKMPLPFDFSQFGLSAGDWTVNGSTGRGQSTTSDPSPGAFGGSAASNSTSTLSAEPGIGAGSGAVGNAATSSGPGGKAYAYLQFFAQ